MMFCIGELFNLGLSKYGLVCFSVLWFEVLIKVFCEFRDELEGVEFDDDLFDLR